MGWALAFVVVLAACGDDGGGGDGGGGRDAGGRDAGGGGIDGGGGMDSGGGGEDGGGPTGRGCAEPAAEWLYCEDFETGGGDWDSWFAASEFLASPGSDDRGRVRLENDQVHGGSWAVHMPAEASSGYQGAGLDWYACDGESREGCPLRSFDELHFRVWVRFAPDHRTIHHFLSIGGSQPDDFWPHGTAGCLPNGSLEMGTTVDYEAGTRNSFFYTYHPEMTCDTRCDRYADVAAICAGCEMRGLPTCDEQPQCCWGENLGPEPPVPFEVDRWFCLEMSMQANTPGEHDGQMAYAIDGVEIHRVTGMLWRTSPTLALNRVRLQHYITSEDAEGHSNRVWFDDLVVSTAPIGCD
jgi:hypothetical protein